MVRGYLRALLSQHSDLLPNEWRFEYGEKGKPRLSDTQFKQTGIHFNLSHSGDWLLVGICVPKAEKRNNLDAVEFGVDIERCRSSTNIHSILSHYFSEPEKAALLALPAELQRERFFDLWALKESYIKAKGLGLALSLKSFAFDFSSLSETPLELDVTKISSSGDAPTSKLSTRHILLKQHISLSIMQAKQAADTSTLEIQTMQPAKNWHCWLGHLDDSYRFAMSIGQCQQVSIKAQQVDFKTLLQPEL
ncbi:4'-phosphopantetheinyl transferase superfamily protein [Shewanella marinintestina]|nr:4'-phosphopantetheinyl transferase superfamily protein [Shewanella marinintestina]